jgi:hypothetical protein
MEKINSLIRITALKYDPGGLFRRADLDFSIPDSGVKKAPDPGSATLKINNIFVNFDDPESSG